MKKSARVIARGRTWAWAPALALLIGLGVARADQTWTQNQHATNPASGQSYSLDGLPAAVAGTSPIRLLDLSLGSCLLKVAGTLPFACGADGTDFLSPTTGVLLGAHAATSVLGRAPGTVGNLADIAAGVDGYVLQRQSGALVFGPVPGLSPSGTGLAVASGGSWVAARSLTSPRATISIGNPDGSGGNPTFDLPLVGMGAQTVGGSGIASVEVDDVGRLIYAVPQTFVTPTTQTGFGGQVVGSGPVVGPIDLAIANMGATTGQALIMQSTGFWGPQTLPAGGISQLTGQVLAGPGTGSQAATIATNTVSDANLRQSTGFSVMGNPSAGLANVQDIVAAGSSVVLKTNVAGTSLGFGLLDYSELTGRPSLAAIATSGSASDLAAGSVPCLRVATFTGDVMNSGCTTAFRSFSPRSVLARAGGTAGIPTELTSSSTGDVLWNNAGALSFGPIPESSVSGLGTDLASKLSQAYTTFRLGLGSALTQRSTINVGPGLNVADDATNSVTTLSVANSGVTAGAYSFANLTVGSDGRLTSAASNVFPAGIEVGNGTSTLTGYSTTANRVLLGSGPGVTDSAGLTFPSNILTVGTGATGGGELLIGGSSSFTGITRWWKDTTPTKAWALGPGTVVPFALTDDLHLQSYNGSSWTDRMIVSNATGAMSFGMSSEPSAPTVAEWAITPPATPSAASLGALHGWDPVTLSLTGTTHHTGSNLSLVRFAAPTITDASAVTVDTMATVEITGAPIASGSVSLTQPMALWIQGGNSRVDGRLALGPATTSAPTYVFDETFNSAPATIDGLRVTNTDTTSHSTIAACDGSNSCGYIRTYGQSFGGVASLAGKTALAADTVAGSLGLVIYGSNSGPSGQAGASISLRAGGYDTAAENLLLENNFSEFTHGNVVVDANLAVNGIAASSMVATDTGHFLAPITIDPPLSYAGGHLSVTEPGVQHLAWSESWSNSSTGLPQNASYYIIPSGDLGIAQSGGVDTFVTLGSVGATLNGQYGTINYPSIPFVQRATTGGQFSCSVWYAAGTGTGTDVVAFSLYYTTNPAGTSVTQVATGSTTNIATARGGVVNELVSAIPTGAYVFMEIHRTDTASTRNITTINYNCQANLW